MEWPSHPQIVFHFTSPNVEATLSSSSFRRVLLFFLNSLTSSLPKLFPISLPLKIVFAIFDTSIPGSLAVPPILPPSEEDSLAFSSPLRFSPYSMVPPSNYFPLLVLNRFRVATPSVLLARRRPPPTLLHVGSILSCHYPLSGP